MNLGKLFDDWSLTGLKINLKFLEAEFEPTTEDKEAAWEMYVELITRGSTQYLLPNHGDEKTSLESIYSLFETTREILKSKGRHSVNFTKVAVIVLNQIIRPFTTKWHKIAIINGFSNEDTCDTFREELKEIQDKLKNYTKLLSALAGVEDLTDIEEEN